MREAVAVTLAYHADIKEDIKRLDVCLKTRIKTAIETRLVTAPQRYGKPLKEPSRDIGNCALETTALFTKLKTAKS